MRRRDFIAGFGAVAWPFAARAQQSNRMRRLGVLMVGNESDANRKDWVSAFTQQLAQLGWIDGRNLRVDVHWAGDNIDFLRLLAEEMADLQLDAILTTGDPAAVALQHKTRTIPIVFVLGSDPVGDGLIASLARPGGNITGFISFEAAMAGKHLELLTEIAPGLKRAALMFDPATGPYAKSYFLPSFETAARALKVAPIEAPVHTEADIETLIAWLGREGGGGLVTFDAFAFLHRTTTTGGMSATPQIATECR